MNILLIILFDVLFRIQYFLILFVIYKTFFTICLFRSMGKMEWRKTIILLMIAIFLFSIAAVSASDVDDMEIASEDANQIELSASNEMNVDNLKTSEENTIETQAKNNKSMSAALGSKLLATDTGTYSDLSNEIGSGGNIELQHDYYTYDPGRTIQITDENTVIDGKGAIIDMDGSNIRAFYVTASGVTFKNLTIKNANYDGPGGAIYFSSSATSGTVTNCNFTNNTADYGGAVYFSSTGEVTNCNFTNNTATYNDGGAVWIYSGNVTNCNFTNNKATGYFSDGGAVYFQSTGEMTNCNFTNNTATNNGGAVHFQSTGEVTNCNFTNNTAEDGGAVRMSSGSVENCNFTNNTASRNGSAVYFKSTGEVTNCNFTNNKATGDYSYGGAVYFQITGNVTNCNFTNNTVTNNGGAVYFEITGNVTNCNFTNNTATYYDGGAVYFRSTGEVTNCNFINNTATRDGGAIDFEGTGTVTNCSFVDNSANLAGAIFSYEWFTAADTCIFKRNSGEDFNVVIYPPTLDVDDFTTFYGSGEKLTFDLKTNISNVPVTNGNISISVYFNNDWVGNYSCLSGEGWIPDLPVGSYIAVFNNTEYAGFQPVSRTVTITIPDVQYYINVTSDTTINKTVNFTAKSDIPKDILWDGKLLFILPNGTEINANYEDDNTWWAVYTFDEYGEYNITASYAGLNNVLVNKGTITINKEDSTIKLDNIVLDYGDSKNITVTTTGATAITAKIDGTDIAVINDYTIPISALAAGNHTLTVTTIADKDHNPITKEVNITVNKLSTEITVNNETLDLKVNDEFAVIANLNPAGAGKPTYSSSNESLIKISDEGLIKALGKGSATVTVSFDGNENYTASQNKTISVTVTLYDASVSAEDIELNVGANATIAATTSPEGLDVTYVPDNSGIVTVDEKGVVTALKEGTATITLTVGGDGVYTENSTTITVTVNKINTPINVSIPENITVGDNSTVNVVLPKDAKGNVTVKVDGELLDTVTVKEGNADVTIPSLSAEDHTVEIAYTGDDKYEAASRTATITVAKDSTNISASGVTATYKVNKYLVITLKDSHGNPLANSTVTVDLNGAKDYVSDENGQVKVKVSNLVPKTYTAKIRFEGSDNYLGSDATAKVVVKKANPKITASNKMFKTTTKTKKYTITLKDNTGKAIKNAKVYLKVNGKTYTAKTNSKGQATFKITKLNKKGTFKATISYKGSKYFNKISKQVNLKVISAWKTISKGSKAKSTVKEIQRALKNHGYYLTAYGHYLKIDGIYWDHTVKAVKQFQKAKSLKVTGKVDEKTAKKLGII